MGQCALGGGKGGRCGGETGDTQQGRRGPSRWNPGLSKAQSAEQGKPMAARRRSPWTLIAMTTTHRRSGVFTRPSP